MIVFEVIRWLVGFAVITFLPGFFLLRLLKLGNLQWIEKLLYIVGLSVAFAMFLGLGLNVILPLLGISEPITFAPIFTAYVVSLLALWFLSRKNPVSFKLSKPSFGGVGVIFWATLIMGLAVLGARWVFHTGDDTLLVAMLIMVAVTPILVVSNIIPVKYFPLMVFAVSFALLFHMSLISNDLFGGDVGREFYFQAQVLQNGVWDMGERSNLNAMLSIVMLSPIYSIIMGLSSVWVFKVIHMLLFATVPLALYVAFAKHFEAKVSFLACFLFMSFPVFFTLAPDIRQPSAEVFLALTLLVLASKELPNLQKVLLLVVFGFALAVSHYGTTYVYLFYILATIPLLFTKYRLYHPAYVGAFVGFAFIWFISVAQGSPFESMLNVFHKVQAGVATGLFNIYDRSPYILQALGLAPLRSSELTWNLARVWQTIVQVFIVVGVGALAYRWCKTRTNTVFTAFGGASLILLALCVIVPYIATVISMMRIFHIVLIFLAPVCILGGMLLLSRLKRFAMPCLVVLVIVPYFLFGSGLLFDLTRSEPSSMPLSLYEIDWAFQTDADMEGRDWLLERMDDDARVYIDANAKGMFLRGTKPRISRLTIRGQSTVITGQDVVVHSYIFLRRWNVEHQEWTRSTSTNAKHYPMDKIEWLKDCELIYEGEAGYPLIYFVPVSFRDKYPLKGK